MKGAAYSTNMEVLMNDSTAKGVVLLAALVVMFTLTVYVCSVSGMM